MKITIQIEISPNKEHLTDPEYIYDRLKDRLEAFLDIYHTSAKIEITPDVLTKTIEGLWNG